ncbi:hemin-degrading factor [Cribrihabitans sp. XS_ASV171]
MTENHPLTGAEIRTRAAQNDTLRARDLADSMGIAEAQLIAAQTGHGVTRLIADPDRIMPLLTGLGEVMALTRNDSCVIEKVGVYDNYHSGQHASMILNDAIDLRMFPAHWVSAFAVEQEGKTGMRRSVQVFDAAGDAVHKVHLRDGSNLDHWVHLVEELRHDDQSDTLQVAPRKPTEAAKADPEKAGILRKEWSRMTDTHQFLRLTSKLKMNRLGAYRIAGEPFVRQLDVSAVNQMLETLAGSAIEIMFFVGNRGCIEIHGGPFKTLKPMGPWQNILDPGFNVHLRLDHVAEVWAVTKPTQRGDAVSVEVFDAEGGLIFQIFGRRSEENDSRPVWNALVRELPSVLASEAV